VYHSHLSIASSLIELETGSTRGRPPAGPIFVFESHGEIGVALAVGPISVRRFRFAAYGGKTDTKRKTVDTRNGSIKEIPLTRIDETLRHGDACSGRPRRPGHWLQAHGHAHRLTADEAAIHAEPRAHLEGRCKSLRGISVGESFQKLIIQYWRHKKWRPWATPTPTNGTPPHQWDPPTPQV
jgi:hypothetical protein